MSEDTKNTESQTNPLTNNINTALDVLINNEVDNGNNQEETKPSEQSECLSSNNATDPSNTDKSIEENKTETNQDQAQSNDLQATLDNLVNSIQEDPNSNELGGTSNNKNNVQSNQDGDTFCTEIDQDKINPKTDPPSRRSPQKTQPEEPGIPPSLKPYITHDNDSLTYRALCGESHVGLAPEVKASVVGDLNKYIDIAVEHGLVGEAYYIQAIVEELKEENSINISIAKKALSDIDARLEEATAELEEKTKLWKQQEEMYEQEKLNECQSLNERYQVAMEELDNSWTAPEKQQHYTKPSSSLLNLRKMLQQMIKAKRFEDVDKLASIIDIKEKEEAVQAAERMKLDYEVADAKLRDVYSMEQTVINDKYESKQNTLIRMRDVSLRPILQRIENLKRSRQKAATTAKNLAGNSLKSRSYSALSSNTRTPTRQATSRQNGAKSTISTTRIVPTTRVPAFVQNPKLSLPSFTPKKRDPIVTVNSANATICKPKTRQVNSRLSTFNSP